MLKGYHSSLKKDGSPVEFPTIEPIRQEQHGLSVLAHMFVRTAGTDAAENDSSEGIIEATAHAALKGDVIRVTSGTYSGREVKVWKTEANLIYISDSIALANGDTFDILRHKYPVVSADGGLTTSSGPTQFVLDGVDTEVSQDTAVPGNSTPLPVIALNPDGTEVTPATAANQASTNTKLDTLIAKDFATQTTLAALLTELQLKADLTETQPVSAASLPLPTGASTAANQATIIAGLASIDGHVDGIETLLGTLATQTTLAALLTELQLKADLTETQPISAASLPLPTGAATSANQTSTNTKLDTLIAKDYATETTLAALSAKIANNFGASTGAVRTAAQMGNASGAADFGAGNAGAQTLRVVPATDYQPPAQDGLNYQDSVRKDYAGGSVTAAAWTELIASTAGAAKGLTLFDSSGQTLELGVGAAASEARKLIIPPGGLNGFIPLKIPAGSRVSVRAVSATASVGELNITLLG